MNEEPTTINLAGKEFVYITPDGIASLEELVNFVNANKEAFYAFRRAWRMEPPTRTMQ